MFNTSRSHLRSTKHSKTFNLASGLCMSTEPSNDKVLIYDSVSTLYSGKMMQEQHEEKISQVHIEDKQSLRVADTSVMIERLKGTNPF